MSTPRSADTTSATRDPPRGSGLAWGGPAQRPVRPHRRLGLVALFAGVLFTTSAAAEPQNFVLDPANTQVHFELKHFGTSTIRGRFDAVEGAITLDRAARTGSVSMSIATASVSTGFAPFDGVIRGPYLLGSAAYPTAYFVASRIEFEGDRVAAVTGEFTLRGTSRALTLRALRYACRMAAEPAREVCGGDFETEFLRSDFGITHSLPFVADRVRVQLQVEAVRQ